MWNSLKDYGMPFKSKKFFLGLIHFGKKTNKKLWSFVKLPYLIFKRIPPITSIQKIDKLNSEVFWHKILQLIPRSIIFTFIFLMKTRNALEQNVGARFIQFHYFSFLKNFTKYHDSGKISKKPNFL